MARIRTIKPEFPHSESMGRVSREARLCFILLWTIADDSGRLRGNSRMLASLLFPYDDDAGSLIDGWLDELEANECILRYKHDGSTYLQICNWLNHQKIDRPSTSKLPEFASPREESTSQRESSARKGREGKGEEGKGEKLTSAADAADPCPHQAIIEIYHRILPGLPRVREWTAARQTFLRNRWKEKPDRQTLDWWEGYFGYVAGCDFLCGRTEGRNGHPPFQADLEWLVRPSNLVKVIEGKYENTGRAA